MNVQSLIADLVSPTPGAKRSPPTPGERGEKGENPRHCWADARANPGRIGAKRGESPRSPADPSPEFAQNSPLFAPDSPAFAPQRTRAVTEDSPNSPLSPGVHGGNCSPARGEHAAWDVVTAQGERLTVHTSPPATLAELTARWPGCQIAPAPLGERQPLSDDALAVSNAFLDHIGETDAEARVEYLDALAQHPERLAGLFERAVELRLARWPKDGERIEKEAAESPEKPAGRAVCASCRHYRHNTLNPAGGLGRCSVDAPAGERAGSLWPHADAWITCPHWHRETAHD